ncbi:MAG: hypothetical protein ACYTFO_02965, partial [Planctomycetota bacterium]
ADRLAVALIESGSYPIVTSPALAEAPQPDRGAPLGRSAILSGEILHHEVQTTEYTQYVYDYPYYYYGRPYYYRRGGYWRGYGYPHYGYPYYGYPYYGYPGYAYTYAQTNAFIVVSAQLELAETGEILHATLPAVSAQAVCDAGSTAAGGRSCLDVAMDRAVWALVGEFAVTQLEIKVDPNKALRIVAHRDENGQWRKKESFTAADTEMTVAVSLPPEADRNTFELWIVRKSGGPPVARQRFTWDRNAPFGDMTLTFSPAAIAAAGGPGKYEAQFRAGGEDVMSRDFKITEAR